MWGGGGGGGGAIFPTALPGGVSNPRPPDFQSNAHPTERRKARSY